MDVHLLDNNSPDQNGHRVTRLLMKVTVEGSVGPVQVVMSPEDTVEDLIKMTLEVYGRERRRPLINELDVSSFELHYSPFSLESLDLNEKLMNLVSRNFFLCQKHVDHSRHTTPSNQTKNILGSSFPLTELMDILL